jgi:hypothetical protein
MLRWICGLAVLGMVSCGGRQEGLEVKAFRLRSAEEVKEENPVVRGERLKRLHGAVSMADRRDRLGDYYTVHWDGPAGREGQEVRIVFDYRQAATGAKVLSMTEERPGAATGTVEFAVTGPAYQKGGRVLAWRIRLYRDGELVDTKRSYLWN